MNRRRFLSGTANTLGALGLSFEALTPENLSATNLASSGEAPRSRPNVLLIMADQHRRTCMGVAGDPVAKTPNIDRLAAESVRFTNVYCTNPVCAPSRASMLTGLYTHNLNARGNGEAYSPRYKTVAEHFGRAGYFTALIGKMHFVDAQVHGFQYQLEFNDWLQSLGPRAKLYADETYIPNSGAGLPQIESLWHPQGDPWKGHLEFDGRLGPVAVGRASKMTEEDHFESFVARESIRFLETHGKADEPFFLVTSFLKPHDPFMPAQRFADMFSAQDIHLSPTWGKANLSSLPEHVRRDIETSGVTPELLHAEEARQRVASYYGSLAQTDDCVGQVLRALTRLDLDGNTIVIYTSDHGEMLGDLGLWNKFQFYEGSCGVPLLIRSPDGTPAICHAALSLISLGATLAELCSVSLPGPSDGRSFASLLSEPSSRRDHGPVFAEFALGNSGEKYMIRDGDYKYTFWVHDIPELYDLKKDPEEMHNLASQPEYQETVEGLKQKLFSWHRPSIA
jgi:choline-sulfatase